MAVLLIFVCIGHTWSKCSYFGEKRSKKGCCDLVSLLSSSFFRPLGTHIFHKYLLTMGCVKHSYIKERDNIYVEGGGSFDTVCEEIDVGLVSMFY